METFFKRNDIGVNIEYTVVARYKNEDKEYLIYTDFVDDDEYVFRLYVDMVNGDKRIPLSDDAKIKILEKFREEIADYFDKMNV